MGANKIFLPMAFLSFFVVGVFGWAVAGGDADDYKKAKLTGSVEPAIAATVNVIDANNEIERDSYNHDELQWEEEGYSDSYDNIVASAEVDPQTGRFEVTDLDAGTYIVEIQPYEPGFEKKEIGDVEVGDGEEKDLGEISLNAQQTYEDPEREY